MDDRIYELMTKIYSEMTQQFESVKGEIGGLKTDVAGLKRDIIRIENDHGKKLDALFGGYKQNTEILLRIEKQVSKHKEIIMRRIM